MFSPDDPFCKSVFPIITADPSSKLAIPPPYIAEFLLKVLLLTVKLALPQPSLAFIMPPPESVAELSASVLLLTFSVALPEEPLLKIPAPAEDELPLMVLLLSCSVALPD